MSPMPDSISPYAESLLSTLTYESLRTGVLPENVAKASAILRRETRLLPVITIGISSCGIAAGALETKEAIQTHLRKTGRGAVEVREVGCMGFCSEEPLVEVFLPGKAPVLYGKVMPGDVPDLLNGVLEEHPAHPNLIGQIPDGHAALWKNLPLLSDHPFFRDQTRLVLKNCGFLDPGSIDEALARGGYRALSTALHTRTPSEVCDAIEASGLRGRGGAGYPTGLKWKEALNANSDVKYVVCNADEGDPGAFIDRVIMESDPHRILESLVIAAYAVGASTAFIYVRSEYKLAIRRLEEAVRQACRYGLLGDNILDSGFDLRIMIKTGAGSFICGEETALIQSMEGKRAMPVPRPPYPTVSGLHRRPTLINNVETLANVPDILLNGNAAVWRNDSGVSKGTKIFSLSGKIRYSGLVEVTFGTPLRKIVSGIGGGTPDGKQLKAVQIGGPSGGCLPDSLLDVGVDYETLEDAGAMMGSAGIIVLDNENCMVDVAMSFLAFMKNESCGKCAPCREGTRCMYEILKRIVDGCREGEDVDALTRFRGVLKLRELGEVMRETCLCGLGRSAPNPVLSTLRHFKAEYEQHLFDHVCAAGVCSDPAHHAPEQGGNDHV